MAIDLEIPADAAPGDYSGTIRVTTADGSFSVEIPVTLTVVPKPDETPPAAEEPMFRPPIRLIRTSRSPLPTSRQTTSGDATVTPPSAGRSGPGTAPIHRAAPLIRRAAAPDRAAVTPRPAIRRQRSELLRRGLRSSGGCRLRLAPGPALRRAAARPRNPGEPRFDAIPHALVCPCTGKGAAGRPLFVCLVAR